MQTLHFLYHEIRPAKSGYTYALDLEEFQAQASFLATRMPTPQADGEPDRDAVVPAITFDDGHRSNYKYALPILAGLGLSARFFITAGWTDVRADFMPMRELRALHQAGQQIGAHGWNHTLLTHCNRDQLQHELGGARRKLEDGLGVAVTTMSLPGGRYNRRVLAACREAGYERVFTSEPRAAEWSAAPTGRTELVGRVNLLGSAGVASLRDLLAPRSAELAALETRYRVKRTLNALLGDALYARVWTLVNGKAEDGFATGPSPANGTQA